MTLNTLWFIVFIKTLKPIGMIRSFRWAAYCKKGICSMTSVAKRADDIKIAYIGGGSRGWAWGLMSDLANEKQLCGEVALYDIDFEAARHNEIIGNKIRDDNPGASLWTYTACRDLSGALAGADFVVISILPGTFDEMESDVHSPERYGIYQSVGDSTGPGGLVRALRTVPMYEEIARAIRDNCPGAWVINYTNPMTVCVQTLYRVFSGIKAFGCCHEVFGTQSLLKSALAEQLGITDCRRDEIRVNVLGINHFTWIDKAYYKSMDIFPVYRQFAEACHEEGFCEEQGGDIEFNRFFKSRQRVKFDLFRRYGVIAAAGDRHLAEFCPGRWYLESPERANAWGFNLTPVSWRRTDLDARLRRSLSYVSGEERFELRETGEDGVKQIKAILGLGDIVTNVNLPNVGQIPNAPLGAVVETNASFASGMVSPVMAGPIPDNVYALMASTISNQECIVEAALTRDLKLAFEAFVKDPLVTVSLSDAKELWETMLDNTKKYLSMYGL